MYISSLLLCGVSNRNLPWWFQTSFLCSCHDLFCVCPAGSLTQGQGQHTAEQAEELRKRKEKMEAHLAREVEEMHQFRQASSIGYAHNVFFQLCPWHSDNVIALDYGTVDLLAKPHCHGNIIILGCVPSDIVTFLKQCISTNWNNHLYLFVGLLGEIITEYAWCHVPPPSSSR